MTSISPNKEEGKVVSPKVVEVLKEIPEGKEYKTEEKDEASSVTKTQVGRKMREKEGEKSSPKIQEEVTVSQGKEGNSWLGVSPAKVGRQKLKQSGESAVVSTLSRFEVLAEEKDVSDSVEKLSKISMEEENGKTKEDSDREEGEIITEKTDQKAEENAQAEKKEEEQGFSLCLSSKQTESPSSVLKVNKKAPPRAGKKKAYKKK